MIKRPFIVATAILVAAQVALAAESTSRPATSKAAATRPANPDFEAGRARARKDLQAGIVAEILPVPEVFLMEWRDPESEGYNLLDYYKAVLADKYEVRSDWVMFNSASPGQHLWALGYNEEMKPAIEKRCGVGTLHKAWTDACKTSNADRAKYLKHRPAPVKSTTQPARPTAQPAESGK